MATFHQWQALQRARIKYKRLLPYLQEDHRYLDIGVGNGALTYLFQQAGLSVTAIDVIDKSLFPTIRPLCFDGQQLPFADNSFDGTLLTTVLHHVHDVEGLLREAQRVTRHEMLIMEDIYTHAWQRWLTWQMDSLVNAEWRGHPHNNRKHEGWLSLFNALGMQVRSYQFHRLGGLFLQVTYRLQP